MKRILIVGGLLMASVAFAWHGNWVFTEVCNQGKVDVTATYTASDNLGGTVQYTSTHAGLTAGATVTANLVEDHAQAASYVVVNTHQCKPPTPTPTPNPSPTPTPTPPSGITHLVRTGDDGSDVRRFSLSMGVVLIGAALAFYAGLKLLTKARQ